MKIPKHAKRVFKGQIFDVYQWEQTLYDGSTAVFESLKRPYTVQIIPVFNKKVVLAFDEQPHRKGILTFLGGRSEEGEEPLDAAKRELLEESGLATDDWELIKSYELGYKMDWTVFLFVARNCKKIADPHLDPGEKITLHEMNFDEFVEKVSSEEFHSKEISNYLFRLKQNPEKLAEFKKKLFLAKLTAP